MRRLQGLDSASFAVARRALFANPSVTSVGIGYRYAGGKKTDQVMIVVGVRKKLPRAEVLNPVPSLVIGMPTDVQDRDVKALFDVGPRSLTQRRRPCPPGYSIGHRLITAGTLGFYAFGGLDDKLRIVSNNHVLANSNDAQPNDEIRQPGTYDGGTASDRFGLLEDYVRIRWDNGDEPPGCLGSVLGFLRRPHGIEQPYPNLVDAAVARPVLDTYCDPDFPFGLGPLKGVKDLVLGDHVQKVGRTTEHTHGIVEGVNTMTKVSYGEGKVATFDDQIEIRAEDGSEFSAGGDSGSAILTEDVFLGGLLFAGGSGVTIANRISHVLSLTGVRL